MSAVAGIDLGSILSAVANWLTQFFNVLVQYAPLIIGITLGGYLIYRFAGTVRRAVGQLLTLF